MSFVRAFTVSTLLLTSCVSVRDFRAVPNSAGLYQAKLASDRARPAPPEYVLRDENRRLVTTEAEADRTMNGFKSVFAVANNTREDKCSVKTLYPAQLEQDRAERALGAKNYAAALEALAASERICPDIYLISAQEYLRAVALSGTGRGAEARVAAQRFLDYSAALTPYRFRQSKGPTIGDQARDWAHDAERLSVYRARTRDFLKDGGTLTWDERPERPSFYANNAFRPGGNRMAVTVLAPSFGFSDVFGPSGGLIAYHSWGASSVSGSAWFTQKSGGYYSIRARRSLYESQNRDFDVDVFGGGATSKQLVITESDTGPFGSIERNVRVVGTAFDPVVGVGGTYRFRPHYGVAGQLTAKANSVRDRVDVGHSLYGFYDLTEDVSLNAGYVESRPMVSVSLLFVHAGYDFRAEQVVVLLHNLVF